MSDKSELYFDENTEPVTAHRNHLFTADELPVGEAELKNLLAQTTAELEGALLRDLELEGWTVIKGPKVVRIHSANPSPDAEVSKGELLLRVWAQVERSAAA